MFLIIITLLKRSQLSDVFSTSEILKLFGLSLILYLVAMKISGLLISFAFGTIERNFNQTTFLFSLLSEFLDGLIYGSFFLGYYFYHKNKRHQNRIFDYHKALSEMRIHQLKSQLNPHFLFNNLNVLDQLIEEDKDKASNFLNEFAEIYRYVLQSSEKKIISLNEELDFAQQYIRLIQHKFGKAYQMKVEGRNNTAYIVPLTLQLLIENAIQHNLATEENPVFINIVVSDNIRVVNNTNLKKNSKLTNGRALINLKEQYKLLTQSPIQVQQSQDFFSVIIPNINVSLR
ncbi:MAG: sensor histidine kinase [Cyclobacteriaceae bacterium]|nr:sensor histidine kinase [Cyclobacteriaceae bacterium]